MKHLLIIFLFFSTTIAISAHQSYTGYSGAPTSNGTCTRSCHHQTAFTPACEVSGFPDAYIPGQQYLVTVAHSGTRSINQFNCSVRKDIDSTIAGTIIAATWTAIYASAHESNGVHLSQAIQDTASFIWQAPNPGVGNVTLYWAGLQGTYSFGADQQIVIHAIQAPTGIEYFSELPKNFALEQNYPNPFNSATLIQFSLTRPGEVVLEIANILGQFVAQVNLPSAQSGRYAINWDGRDYTGKTLPSGLYFYQLRTPEGHLTRKMTILR